MPKAFIAGTGHYLPPRVVTNEWFTKHIETSDKWIIERTGIKERRFVEPGVGPSDLAIPACETALEEAELKASDIDFIIFATSTPDSYVPGSACHLQHKMGFGDIGALDIRVQCAGFVYGLSIADQFIKSGQFKNILLIGAEVQSSAIDLTNRGRDTAVIFADGAGAAVIRATEEKERGVLSTHLHSDGKHIKDLWLEAPSSSASPRLSPELLEEGRHYLQMNGSEVFRHAVTKFPETILEALKANNLTVEDLDLLVPHQANLRITQAVQKRLGLPDEKVVSNIEKYGNTTAASIPIALSEAVKARRVSPGDIVVLASFGSGFTWASAAIRW